LTRQRSVTLTDVARLAGVSVATASKALNGRDEVAPATRDRVVAAAEKLSFQPNALARGLISGRTRTIGLLTDELGGLSGRFAMPVLLGVENALGNEQMSVLLCDARGDPIRRRHYIRTLLARQVDGFIVLGDSNDMRSSLMVFAGIHSSAMTRRRQSSARLVSKSSRGRPRESSSPAIMRSTACRGSSPRSSERAPDRCVLKR
jgi:DNA-binding LacI/PurR family transcriptional regulator